MTMNFKRCQVLKTAATGLAMLALDVSCLQAQAPRVVRTIPGHAEAGVQPDLAEIRVEFDQDMDPGGYSVCGGGPEFPKLNGKPRWIDSRTFSIPVQLEAGKAYSLSINCASNRNFRSTEGTPSRNYPLQFRCGGPDDPPPVVLTREQNEAALRIFAEAIQKRYSYRDLRNIDWQTRLEEYRERFLAAERPSDFARTASQFLEMANDPHIQVQVNGFSLFAWPGNPRTPNFRDAALGAYLSNVVKHNPSVISAELPGGIPYLLIAGWTGNAETFQPALEFVDQNAEASSMVIDVRVNGGGDETHAMKLAGCFLTEPVIYSRVRSVDPGSESGFGPWADRVVVPNPDHRRFSGKVAVLMGPLCMSSNESFLLMMQQAPHCTLFGERSFGSSGNPKPHDLGNGVTVLLPSWQNVLPDDSTLEGVGVNPDVTVPFDARNGGERDPVLEAAIDHLQQGN